MIFAGLAFIAARIWRETVKARHAGSLSMAGPMFIVDFEPHYGQMVDVSPLLRRMVCRNPSKFTFHGTGTYVIGRVTSLSLIRAQRDEQHVEALLRALDGERARHILITHTHGDHSPAAAALSDATGAPVLGFGHIPTRRSARARITTTTPMMRVNATARPTRRRGLRSRTTRSSCANTLPMLTSIRPQPWATATWSRAPATPWKRSTHRGTSATTSALRSLKSTPCSLATM